MSASTTSRLSRSAILALVAGGGAALGAGAAMVARTDGPTASSILPAFETRPLPHVANTAALAALTPATGEVFREGYAHPGDGGGAHYVTSTSTCPQTNGMGDGGSCIGLLGPNNTSGAYVGSATLEQSKLLGGLSPCLFMDCTIANNPAFDTAFDAAFAALPASGGTILIPAGAYQAARSHSFANKPVTIRGQGKGISNIGCAMSGPCLTISETGPNAIFNRVNLSGFSMYAGLSSGPTSDAIIITYPTGASFPAAVSTSTFGLDNVEMLSVNSTSANNFARSFTHGITLNGVWNARLYDPHYVGPIGNPAVPGSYAIGFNQVEDVGVVRPYVEWGEAAFMFLANGSASEGVVVDGKTVVGTDWSFEVAESATPNASFPTVLVNLLHDRGGEANNYLGVYKLRLTQNFRGDGGHGFRYGNGSNVWKWAQLTDVIHSGGQGNSIEGGGTPANNIGIDLVSDQYGSAHNDFVDNNIDTRLVATPVLYEVTARAGFNPIGPNIVRWAGYNGIEDAGSRTWQYGDTADIRKIVQLKGTTANANAGVRLTTDGNAPNPLNCLPIPPNATYGLDIVVTGRNPATGDSVTAHLPMVNLQRGKGNASTIPAAGLIVPLSSQGNGPGMKSIFQIGADTRNQCLDLAATGIAMGWRWNAEVRVVGVQD